jgi:hypothetical protein
MCEVAGMNSGVFSSGRDSLIPGRSSAKALCLVEMPGVRIKTQNNSSQKARLKYLDALTKRKPIRLISRVFSKLF